MKIILSLLLLTVFVSCSQPNSEKSHLALDEVSNVIDFGELNVFVPNSGILPAPQSLDFASLAFKQSGTQNLVITNISNLDLVYSAIDFDSSLSAPFIVSNECVGTIRPRKKCSIKFILSNPTSLATEQTLTSLFKIKGIDVSLTGILEADATDYTAPTVNISVSPLVLNFGSFKVGEFKELSIALRNNGLASAPFDASSLSNPNVSIVSNTCPSSLIPRRPCAIKLRYTGVVAEVKNGENLLKVANYQISHSAIVTSPSVSEPEVLNIQPAQSSIALSITQPATQVGSIRYTNIGTVGLSAPVSAVSSDDGVVILSISCVGGLQRSKTCDIHYTINSSLLPSGASVQNIKLQSGTLSSALFLINLNVTPITVSCTLVDAQVNGVVVTNSNSTIVGTKNGSDISQCLLAANSCNPSYSLSSNSKSCIYPAPLFRIGENPGFNGPVLTTVIQADGKIIAGGSFTSYSGVSQNSIARFNTDGSLDTLFNNGFGFSGAVNSIAIQTDGKIIVGGAFTSYGGVSKNGIARLNTDGSLDSLFNNSFGFSGAVNSLVIQADGKIIVGGAFTSYGSTFRIRVARLNADGTIDLTFNSGVGPNLPVSTVASQSDGKILIGGLFNFYNGTPMPRMARLNVDGSLDATFNPAVQDSAIMYAIAVQPNGKIIVGGPAAPGNIARLSTDGSLDTTFNTGFGALGPVSAITLQPNGKIVIGGLFSVYNVTPISKIARLNIDGSLDTTFNPGFGANNSVNSISIQANGNIVIGGEFTSFNGLNFDRIIRVESNGDSEILD